VGLNNRRVEKLHNEGLHIWYTSPNIIIIIKSRMRCTGHVASMGEKMNAQTSSGESQKGKIPLGTFRFHKILGNSRVAERQTISQEQLGSMNLSGGCNTETKYFAIRTDNSNIKVRYVLYNSFITPISSHSVF
jgi:hypothetical protein